MFEWLHAPILLWLIQITKYHLRSSVAPTLKTAKVRILVTLGGRAFQFAGPKLWNILPANICQIESLDIF